jgi:YVTN family beta-propeller protein
MHSMRWVLAGLVAVSASAASAAEPARGVAYVSNQNASLSVIDLDRLETVGTIDNGSTTPRGLGISDDGRWLVTANRDAGNLSIIERATGKVARQVEIGANPEFVRVRGKTAFVSYEPSSKGGPPVAGGHDDDDENGPPAQIAVVDIEKGTVVRRILGGKETEGLEFSADGKQLLVTNEADDTITVHDIATGKLVRTIPTIAYGKRPRGIKRSPDSKTYVATLEIGNQLLVLDAKTFEVKRSVPTADFPYGLAFDHKGAKLYVAAARAKVLQVFDTKTWASTGSAPTGDRCWHFTFTPDDAQLLVVCGRSNEVVVLDTKTLAPVKRIEDKELPWGAVTWPKSMGSLDVPAR